MVYRLPTILLNGSLSIFCATNATAPTIGPPARAANDKVSLICGSTCTFKLTVSVFKFVSPSIVAFAAGPSMTKLSLRKMPLSIFAVALIVS